jgi:DNA-3-methyladenine glycosylase I
MNRCPWCGTDPLYVKYHDEEWGVPVHDDQIHFEFLVLESAQAGLSWITILRKRENYRLAYKNFDAAAVAAFTEKDEERLLNNPGIIRNKLKIKASINNAKLFLKIQEEFGSFDTYLWAFVDGKPVVNHFDSLDQLPAKTALSEAVSRDLKKRGFKFLGPTIMYSHLQAVGLVNDHLTTCLRRQEILDKYGQ